MILLAVLIALLLPVTAFAQEKPKGLTCQEQLSDVSVQAYNLDADRDQKERTLARAQTTIYALQQQVSLLQKQISDMKKAVDPKAEDKPKE